MNRIKFIFETKAKRKLWSLLAVGILFFTILALMVNEDYQGFFYGVALGGAFYGFLEFFSLFLYKNFVVVGHNFLFVRVKSFFFTTLLLDQVQCVELVDDQLCFYLPNKTMEISTDGIETEDVHRLVDLVSKWKKA
jgi:hypothetical protein